MHAFHIIIFARLVEIGLFGSAGIPLLKIDTSIMNKGARYLVAIITCIAIFALWVVFQLFVAKGVLVGVIFCSAMVAAWKGIVGTKKQ